MMKCKRARLAIALAVGNDLGDAAEGELQQHLAGCATCRMHRRELESSLGALQTGPDEDFAASQDSVWPALLVRLPSTREQRFNGWIPAAALAAACLMMISIVNEPGQYGPTDGEPYAVPAFRVANQSQFSRLSWPDLERRPDRAAEPSAFEDVYDIEPPVELWLDPKTGRIFQLRRPLYNR